ncbi:hypothetical protein POVWA2_011330 [Plasmodium ovale wallikeri]|uniref:Uncharacterized protein n=1 Tax=Plasmodium ovale wallikeri TaxID=864142 RepID=A0A1A8YL07_PLAOA|nr:hypothetical protein POVWA1_011150 [Plasmodium ovale wallikeri]SBT32754.1 hypothetical protein POVWA2_011330 [Plasmodium ovale wallikeri]
MDILPYRYYAASTPLLHCFPTALFFPNLVYGCSDLKNRARGAAKRFIPPIKPVFPNMCTSMYAYIRIYTPASTCMCTHLKTTRGRLVQSTRVSMPSRSSPLSLTPLKLMKKGELNVTNKVYPFNDIFAILNVLYSNAFF